MQKLYAYVDEFGQHTKGEVFLVSVVVVQEDRDRLTKLLEEVERSSSKGKVKWMAARHPRRTAYIQTILHMPEFKGKLNYAVYRHTTAYLACTMLTTARAVLTYTETAYKASVFVDGLPQSQIPKFGAELRRLQVRTEKVRGVRDEKADAFIRLADALCGFIGAALSGNTQFSALLERAQKEGYVREL